MPSTREKLPNEPIVVVTLGADYDASKETSESIKHGIAFLDSLEEPVFYIIDTSAIQFNIVDLVQGSNQAARGENPLFHHPNIRQIIYVTQSDLSKLAAQGMNSEAFGNLNIMVYQTLEEALDGVRAIA